MKPVVSRPRATHDIDDAIDHYLAEGAVDAAQGLIDRLEAAFSHLSRFPGSGSPRYGLVLRLPSLRSWPVAGYPYLIFYVETNTHIDVWRVLHAERDIPQGMQEHIPEV